MERTGSLQDMLRDMQARMAQLGSSELVSGRHEGTPYPLGTPESAYVPRHRKTSKEGEGA